MMHKVPQVAALLLVFLKAHHIPISGNRQLQALQYILHSKHREISLIYRSESVPETGSLTRRADTYLPPS